MGRGIKAGCVWTNCHHLNLAHAAFGGCKQPRIGRETHRRMPARYQQAMSLLVICSPTALGSC